MRWRDRRIRICALAIAATSLLVVAGASAAAGDLDEDFSEDGWLSFDMGSTQDWPSAIVQQADGDALVVGVINPNSPDSRAAVARVSSSGLLDEAFTENATSALSSGPDWQVGEAVAALPSGKVIVAGDVGGGGWIKRLRADGTLDGNFSVANSMLRHFSISDLAVQPDGKIVAVGSDSGTGTFILARLLPGGRFDRGFAADGIKRIRFPSADGYNDDFGTGVELMEDGRIVGVGRSMLPKDTFDIARLLPDGRFDRTFGGGDGRVRVGFKGQVGNWVSASVALDSRDRVVVTGPVNNGQRRCRIGVIRLLTRGRLDSSFAGNGARTISFGGEDRLHACHSTGIAIDSAKRILICAVTAKREGSGRDFGIARMLPKGKLDDAFAGDGRLALGFGEPDEDDFAGDLLITPEGDILATGGTRSSEGWDYVVARFDSE